MGVGCVFKAIMTSLRWKVYKIFGALLMMRMDCCSCQLPRGRDQTSYNHFSSRLHPISQKPFKIFKMDVENA
jgi:hypothetical protein